MLTASRQPHGLLLQDCDYGTRYGYFALADGESFSVSFIHSVNKSEVRESYQRRGSELYLTQCVYYNFGAGVATDLEPGQSLSYGESGEMILSGLDTRMNELIYVVGTVSDHTLLIGGEEISLRELCGKNSHVRFLLH